MSASILIVDDETLLVKYVTRLLQKRGYQVAAANDAKEARQQMARYYPDVVLMDIKLPDANGQELMAELKERYPDTCFIIVTGHGSIRSAVESTRQGACDYLTKPFDPEEMYLSLRNALRDQMLGEEVRRLRCSCASPASCKCKSEEEASSSQAMRRVYDLARRAARQDGIVLLLGESGTGKDHMARWLHQHSPRAEGPFFSINCAALSKDLAESELFGHEPGAFTGTRGRKRGLLELAQKGSLLLNEIGELDPSLQSKLLTFLDTKTFLRVGGEKSIAIDTRILAATNRDLADEVEAGRFRRDLFYRLHVFPLHLPSLSERSEDIPLLVMELLDRLAADLGLSQRPTIEANALEALKQYPWPGNIRELRNILERSLMLSDSNQITYKNLNFLPQYTTFRMEIQFPNGKNLHEITQDVARGVIQEALRRSNTKKEAAQLLGISRHALAHQIKSLNISD
jgi:DNA-binding NtrC family response regulator